MLSIVSKCWKNLCGMPYQNHVILDKFLLLDHLQVKSLLLFGFYQQFSFIIVVI